MRKSIGRVFVLFGAVALSASLVSSSLFAEEKKAEPAKPAPAPAPAKKAEPAAVAKKADVKPYEILLDIDKKDGIYKTGDTVTFTIQFLKDGKPAAGQKMGYFLYTDDGKKQMELFTTKEETARFQAKLTSPGSLRVEAAALSDDGKIMKMEVGREPSMSLLKWV